MPVSKKIEKHNGRILSKLLAYTVPFLISLALCVIVFYQTAALAPRHKANVAPFNFFGPGSLEEGLDRYREVSRREWRTRLFSNYMASKFTHLPWPDSAQWPDSQKFGLSVGAWVAFWLFLTNLLFILMRQERALFFLFGTFAAVSFGYTLGITEGRIYPWDMPALFFFTLFVFLVDKEKLLWLLPLLPLATAFKETAVILAAAFLFWEPASWKRRILFVGVATVTAVAAKLLIDVVTSNPHPFFTMTTVSPVNDQVRLWLNYQTLRTASLNHPVFINAGTLLAFLLLPIGSRRMLLLKSICLLFMAGNFVYGMIQEYRIWFEMIPVALYGLELYVNAARQAP